MSHKYDSEACKRIVACYGNVNVRSAAKMCNTSKQRVYNVWNYYGLKDIKRKHKYYDFKH